MRGVGALSSNLRNADLRLSGSLDSTEALSDLLKTRRATLNYRPNSSKPRVEVGPMMAPLYRFDNELIAQILPAQEGDDDMESLEETIIRDLSYDNLIVKIPGKKSSRTL